MSFLDNQILPMLITSFRSSKYARAPVMHVCAADCGVNVKTVREVHEAKDVQEDDLQRTQDNKPEKRLSGTHHHKQRAIERG